MVEPGRWTCPDCDRTYVAPAGWEIYVWAGARRAAQVFHAQRHGRQALVEQRRRLTDPEPDYGTPTT
jgi:hypothetical protein